MGIAFVTPGGREDGRRKNRLATTLECKPRAARPAAGNVSGQPMPPDTEVPREQWLAFLDSFSRQHLHWMATIEATTAEGTVVIVEERPFEGISVDHADGGGRVYRLYIEMGETVSEQMTHIIHAPCRILFRLKSGGEHRGLEIISADGRTTFLRFRSEVRPELLDGV